MSSALIEAASRGDETSLQKLLTAEGVALDLRDSNDLTALMRAASNGHEVCTQMLIQAGAALDLQTIRGLTALMFAALCSRDTCVQKLIEAGANIDLQSKDGRTARSIIHNWLTLLSRRFAAASPKRSSSLFWPLTAPSRKTRLSARFSLL